MSGIVENNVVTMEWQKSSWLQTKGGKGRNSAFIVAAQDYTSSTHGTISVFFTAHTAFLHIDGAGTADEDIWNAEDFISAIKGNIGGNFPYDLDGYYPVIDAGEDNCKVAVLEKYGLVEHKADIEKRMLDVRPYGEEKTVQN